MMFRSYSNTSEYFLRDYVAKAMVIMLSSRVKISCLRAKAHLVFHWRLYNKNAFSIKVIAVAGGFKFEVFLLVKLFLQL